MLSSLLIVAVLAPALTFRVCIAVVALAEAAAALLILVFVASSKSTVYFVMLSASEDDVTLTTPSVAAATVAPLALIFNFSFSPVPSVSILAMFVPATILFFKKVGSIAFLASSCAIVSACFLFTASPSSVPLAMFVILLPPLFKPSLPRLTFLLSSVLPFGLIVILSPVIVVVSPVAFLNSAEVRPFRALASLIFSVSPLASTPMLLVLSSVVAPPLIFSSLFVLSLVILVLAVSPLKSS